MKSLDELANIQKEALADIGLTENSKGIRIAVGMATCGISAGAEPVLEALKQEIKIRNLKDVTVYQTGCIGICKYEPIIEIYEAGKDKVTYVEMTAEKAKKIIAKHVVNGNVIGEYTIGNAK